MRSLHPRLVFTLPFQGVGPVGHQVHQASAMDAESLGSGVNPSE
ncbi:uncharacterized protein METZ01_LOCUS2206 [marine metagenome]|uniref:Uncharacterized protein n=1 Tax=marine metagenome TaxID=408172 RepID=A0A381N422_9ZZZZ